MATREEKITDINTLRSSCELLRKDIAALKTPSMRTSEVTDEELSAKQVALSAEKTALQAEKTALEE